MGIYVLSHRNVIAAAHYAHIYELENVVVDTCQARLLAPHASDLTQAIHKQGFPKPLQEGVFKRLLNKTRREFESIDRIDGLSSDETNVLLLIGMHGGDVKLLNCVKEWRQKFDRVIVFVYDSWILDAFPRYTSQIDCLFVAIKDLIEPLRQKFSIPVSYCPYSANVLGRGSFNTQRSIDVASYGRIPSDYHNRLFAFNDRTPHSPGNRDFFYYRQVPESAQPYPSEPFTPLRFDYQHSVSIGHVLANSIMALAFDFTYTVERAVQLPKGHNHPSYHYRKPVLGLRWYEGIAAGTALVGKKPPIPETDALLNWEDATIELPDDPAEGVEAIMELLQDTDRLQAIHQRNFWHALQRHDHRQRLTSMFAKIDLDIPTRLHEQLEEIESLCSESGIQFE